jgi:hypothetical protein
VVLLIALAAVIVLGALLWLVRTLVRTWKLVRVVGRSIGESSDRIAAASAGLQAVSGNVKGPEGEIGAFNVGGGRESVGTPSD